jgi:hypothetical protein
MGRSPPDRRQLESTRASQTVSRWPAIISPTPCSARKRIAEASISSCLFLACRATSAIKEACRAYCTADPA